MTFILTPVENQAQAQIVHPADRDVVTTDIHAPVHAHLT
jgi:hypothetical protein